jgi:hypothetical protein
MDNPETLSKQGRRQTKQKTTHIILNKCATRTPLKTGGEHRCSCNSYISPEKVLGVITKK